MARVPKMARETILRGTRHTLEIKQICVKIVYIYLLFIYFIFYFTRRSLGIGRQVISRCQNIYFSQFGLGVLAL